ncbi:hypothetical protein SAY86_030412 [Trapa natans]|uniref:Uncharacterized protein n=1 Tax=Trapa natans TaxID=22666 RepID=A0AAN7M2U6_TRANT|nr:hypothetical protein SAY86_030412 [Trapa natans]
MGNSIGGGRKRVKVMNASGEILKLKTPVRAYDVVKDYPGHVLMDSMAVKHLGIKAQPLEPHQELKPNKVYFLVELPKFPDHHDEKAPRRVRSGINMTAKDRLEFLKLSRRSASDLVGVRQSLSGRMMVFDGAQQRLRGSTQVKLTIPKAQLDRLVEESVDGVNVAEKILDLYRANASHQNQQEGPQLVKPSLGRIDESFKEHKKKHVSFNTVEEIPPPHLPPLIHI